MAGKVIIAEHSGFCFGVKRAICLAMDAKGRAFTLGEIVHSPQVVAKLEENGIMAVDGVSQANGGSLIIMSHGVPMHVIDKARKKGLKIIDATCPYVKRVHDVSKEMERQGMQVIIVGEKEHPEVKGIAGSLKNPIITETAEDAKKLKRFSSIGIVSQTTQQRENFESIVSELQKHADAIRAENTICLATRQRQDSAKELAAKVDIMVIIGGKNSGNTRRLAELCSKIIKTIHIETADELDSSLFEESETVGISAGASTPAWLIDEVKEQILKIKE